MLSVKKYESQPFLHNVVTEAYIIIFTANISGYCDVRALGQAICTFVSITCILVYKKTIIETNIECKCLLKYMS